MRTGQLIGLLGWITALSYGVAISNFFVKYINKKYISKLGVAYKQIADFYRVIMKLVVRTHKLAGVIAIISLTTHFLIAFSRNIIPATGVIAAVLMFIMLFLGIYGAYINKSYKGLWLKVHRIL